MWHILSMCRLHASSYDPDLNLTVRREGMRDVGLQLLGLMEAVRPHAHVELMQEAKAVSVLEREENDDRASD